MNKKNMATLSDEELLMQYKASGNVEYFGTLYHRYIPLLYGMCLKYLHDENKSYDAVIKLFEDLLPQAANCEPDIFKVWLYKVARNRCLHILQKEKEEIPVDLDRDFTESDEILHLLCEEKEDTGRMQALQNCLSRLPDGQRITITHFFLKEMSYADIVEKTGYSLHTVKSNIRNGKRNLRVCLKKHSK